MGVPDKQLWYKADHYKKWCRHEGVHEIRDFKLELAGETYPSSPSKRHTTKASRAERRLKRKCNRLLKKVMWFESLALHSNIKSTQRWYSACADRYEARLEKAKEELLELRKG
jgi:hypothetical protein